MKALFVSILFPLVVNSNPVSTLQNTAYGAILEYFQSSNRVIETFQWSNLSVVDAQSQDYLAEADIFARNRNNQKANTYHCGVFVRKVNSSSWQILATSCEVLSDRRR